MPVIDKADRILQDVLDRITPTQAEEERTSKLVDGVVQATKDAIKGTALDHVIAGSFTRGTWMKDKKEFDIFIRFPVSTTREGLEKTGLELGKAIAGSLKGRPVVAYAEHPYVRISLKEYEVDVVPCYRVESALSIKSAVDRTPFHNEWLSRHFKPGLAPEARLLKQFCKGQGIYGSDTRTQGFSGYLCELLVVYFKSFKSLLRYASLWRAGKTFINLEGEPVDDIKSVHRKFPKQPLIVIDPVDPGRNVAAALSPENFIRFTRACRDFLAKPVPGMFFREPPAPVISRIESLLAKRKTRLIGISCKAPRGVIDDVLWPQLRRTQRRLRDILNDAGFHVHGSGAWSDRKSCTFFFELAVFELPAVRKLEGPSVFAETNSKNFLKKYGTSSRVWVEDDLWVAEVPRTFREPSELLKKALSAGEAGLRSIGIASYPAKEIARSFNVLSRRDLIAQSRRDKAFGQQLQNYLETHLA